MENPRPLNKREFLTTLSEPYVQPEIEIQPYSNPNSTYSIDVQPGQPEFNRALEDGNRFKPTYFIVIKTVKQ